MIFRVERIAVATVLDELKFDLQFAYKSFVRAFFEAEKSIMNPS